MTKNELKKGLANKFGYTAKQSKEIVEYIFDEMFSRAVNGEEIILGGLGRIKQKTTNARVCRNPRTGASVNVPSKRTLTFSIGARMLEQLNK